MDLGQECEVEYVRVIGKRRSKEYKHETQYVTSYRLAYKMEDRLVYVLNAIKHQPKVKHTPKLYSVISIRFTNQNRIYVVHFNM